MSSSSPPWLRGVAALVVAVFVLVAVVPAVAAAPIPKLVEIRAAHHPGFDRIVFEFTGPVPGIARVKWATNLKLDPSNKPANVQGNATLRVRFAPAAAHRLAPPYDPTIDPAPRALALPNIAHLVLLGDFEGEVSYGIGLMKKTRIIRATKLTKPSRFVIDIATDFKKKNAKVFFFDENAAPDATSLVVPVQRRVPRPGGAKATLYRLWAGPTRGEQRAGLSFFDSGTTGFKSLDINSKGVARVTLRGPCDSGGSAVYTVASEIMPTLRRFGRIDWIKIYDRSGETLYPWGRSDSLPACLQP